MMNEFIVKVEKSTRMVDLPKNVIGNDMENLQEKLIFKFTDEFVNGQGRLEYKIGSTRDYIVLSKENDTYTIPVQNVITKEGKIEMQLVITEGTNEQDIPVFKSNTFYLYCNKSINAVDEAPDGYELWIEQANAKLNAMDIALDEVETIDIDVEKEDSTTTVTLTKKDGTTKTVNILDGVDGINGQDGRDGIDGQDGANGQDGFSPIATVTETSDGATISITDKNGTTTAKIYNGTGGGGTSDYRNLENKPQINNVELTGNKTSSDLGLQPAGNYVIDSNYVHTDNNYSSNEKNKLASLNNYDDTEIKQDIINLESNIPTKLSDLTNDGNFVTDNNYVHTDNNFTDNLKNKLDGIETDATRTIVDSSITNTSTNPVESKVIYNALNSKLDTSLKGSANGIAELDSNGKILESQLPSYVDDVLEGYYYNNNFYEDSAHTELITGETGKIYIDLATNKTYRWGGSTYVLISETITLGETSSTAYRGDRGKIAYEHSLVTSGNPHNVTKSDIGLENVENKSSATIRGEITSSNVTNALGYTPYDATNPNGYTSNAGTITGITMNGVSKGTSGVVNLGTVITSHQDVSGKEDKSNKVTSISSSSTDTEYPSAKAVYDYIQSLDGDEVYY